VVRAPIDLEITARGRLAVDETRLHDIALKLGGFVSELRVNASGQTVTRGDVLFTLYSPELYAAQQEYLIARQSADATGGERLVHAVETRLRLWGVSDDQVAALARRGEPIERVAFRSPVSGVVIEKNVVDGAAVAIGQRLFRIADLDEIWVEAEVYESDLPRITRRMPAAITLDYLPGKVFEGRVAFVSPYLDPASRTGRVRIALPNPGRELKPGHVRDGRVQAAARAAAGRPDLRGDLHRPAPGRVRRSRRRRAAPPGGRDRRAQRRSGRDHERARRGRRGGQRGQLPGRGREPDPLGRVVLGGSP
jgi:Cu(I)/Ag(I) efflux system membrane fusion protein